MFGIRQKTFRIGVASVSIAVCIQLSWLLVAPVTTADDVIPSIPDKEFSSGNTSGFQFARLHYPGGVPGYLKNWYTDYPAMDKHLTLLVKHLTNIDTALPITVDGSSRKIFEYPLTYSVEPEQMVIGPRDAANLREYLVRGGCGFAGDFQSDD